MPPRSVFSRVLAQPSPTRVGPPHLWPIARRPEAQPLSSAPPSSGVKHPRLLFSGKGQAGGCRAYWVRGRLPILGPPQPPSGSPGGSVKNLPTMWETRVRSLGREDPLEKGTATHSRILTWRISWTKKPGGIHTTQFMGSQRSDTTDQLMPDPSKCPSHGALVSACSDVDTQAVLGDVRDHEAQLGGHKGFPREDRVHGKASAQLSWCSRLAQSVPCLWRTSRLSGQLHVEKRDIFLGPQYPNPLPLLPGTLCPAAGAGAGRSLVREGRGQSGITHVIYCIQGGSAVKNQPDKGDIGGTGSIPGLGRSPGEGNGNPVQYSRLENPMDRGA